MIINYLGHSAFKLRGKFSVVTDPFGDIGYKMQKQTADFCLCSHLHFDHNASDLVDCKFVTFGEKIDSGSDISLEIIPSFHDEFLGAKRGKNSIYKFVIDDICFCHMGDFGENDFSSFQNRINKVDVLMIPIGGKYTISPLQAIEIIDLLKPKIAIPMHYKTAKSTIDIKTIDEFLRLNKYEIIHVENEFELTKENLPNKTTVYIPKTINT